MASATNGVNGHKPSQPQSLIQTLNNIGADSFINDGERIEAVLAAYALVSRLETPWEFVARTCMGQVPHNPYLSWHQGLTIQSASTGSCFEGRKRPKALRQMA